MAYDLVSTDQGFDDRFPPEPQRISETGCDGGDWWEKDCISDVIKFESFTAQTKLTFDQAYEGKMSCYFIPTSSGGVVSTNSDCVLKGFKRWSDQVGAWKHIKSTLTITVEIPPHVEIGLSVGATMIRPFFPKSFEVFPDKLLELTVQGQKARATQFHSLLHMSSEVKTALVAQCMGLGLNQFVNWSAVRPPQRAWYYIVGLDVFDECVKYVNATVHLRSDFCTKRAANPVVVEKPKLPVGLSDRELLAMDNRMRSFLASCSAIKEGRVCATPVVAASTPVTMISVTDSAAIPSVVTAIAKTSDVVPLPPPIPKPSRVLMTRQTFTPERKVTVNDGLTDQFSALTVQDIPDNCGKCAMCDTMAAMTKHHLVPKQVHNRCALPRAALAKTINICRPCHDAIHHYHTNFELALEYSTIDSLVQLATNNGRVCQQIRENNRTVREFGYIDSQGTVVNAMAARASGRVPRLSRVDSSEVGSANCFLTASELVGGDFQPVVGGEFDDVD